MLVFIIGNGIFGKGKSEKTGIIQSIWACPKRWPTAPEMVHMVRINARVSPICEDETVDVSGTGPLGMLLRPNPLARLIWLKSARSNKGWENKEWTATDFLNSASQSHERTCNETYHCTSCDSRQSLLQLFGSTTVGHDVMDSLLPDSLFSKEINKYQVTVLKTWWPRLSFFKRDCNASISMPAGDIQYWPLAFRGECWPGAITALQPEMSPKVLEKEFYSLNDRTFPNCVRLFKSTCALITQKLFSFSATVSGTCKTTPHEVLKNLQYTSSSKMLYCNNTPLCPLSLEYSCCWLATVGVKQ